MTEIGYELISIIIPVYNMEEYISICLESVITQTYKNLEIIVIDDGSTDKSAEIIDRYAESDDRIVVIHQRNQGLVQSRKNGLEIARGKYVGFVDSDDWIDSNMYEFLIYTLKKHNAQVVTSGRYVEGIDTLTIPDKIEPGVYHPLEDEYFCSNIIWSGNKELWGITPNFWNKLFVKDKIIKFEKNVDGQITYGEDDACVYPCMVFSDTVVVTDRCFYHYRMREHSMSSSSDCCYFDKINKLYLILKEQFEKHPFKEILLYELGLYMTEFAIRGINGLWGLASHVTINRNWIDMSFLLNGKRLILYGAGKIGKEFFSQLKYLGLSDGILWVDKQYKKYNELGLNVCAIDEIQNYDYDYIIIAVYEEKMYNEIKKELLDLEIEESKIIWGKGKKHNIFE